VAVFCRTKLNYSASSSSPATAIEVDVLDGRTAALPSWTVCGFELLSHMSRVSSWDRDDEIVAVHYPEVEDLACRLTGCDHAMVSTHIKRNPAELARHHHLGPIRFVHSDFARGHDELIRRAFRGAMDDPAVDVPQRHAAMVDAVENARRVVVLQFWRNLGPPTMDFPIAFCDARTVRVDEAQPFVVSDYAGARGQFEALAVIAPSEPDRHHWYAFPDMTADETVAFRTYDTDIVGAGGTFFTPHSAFRDPRVEVGQPARSSIELRATCLFG